jgi:predicted ArsR family transcriptional regulator
VSRAREARSTPGRPRWVYRATAKATEEDGRNYRLLAEILARYLVAASPSPGAAAVDAGRAFGHGLAEPHAARSDDAVAALVGLLEAIGFAPEASADGESIHLHHCPFRELAQKRRNLVCGIHLGLMQGALAELGSPLSATRLLPFVEPELCVATLGREDA